MATRCPACGQFHEQEREGRIVPLPAAELTFEGLLISWAVELTRGSMPVGEPPGEIAERFAAIYAALRKALPGVEDAARS